MTRSYSSDIKRERKKSLFLREVTTIINELAQQEPAVAGVYVSTLELSANLGICYIYLSAYQDPGEEIFNKALAVLKLYKPSLRKAFASRVQTRYAPDLVFVYDKAKERERVVNNLLDKVRDQLEQSKDLEANDD
jgi:ribosome-binding factor A